MEFDFWFLKILKLYFESELPLLGGLFYKTFWFEASLYMFLIFWNFRGSFLSLIFGFWKFWNCILNQNSHFWGVYFIKLFYLRPPYTCFKFFGTLGVLFWVWFLVSENFVILFSIRIPCFGGLFYKTFWFEASLYMFLIFWNFRGSFLSLIFGFWKFWNCILNQNSHFWRFVL